jgi:glycosyltransferase involved in cell wall biosynthesis
LYLKFILREKLFIKGRKIFLCVGRYIQLKNYHKLIEMWSKLKKDYYLYLIGEGEEEPTYYKLIRDYNLQNVILIGFKDKTTLFNYYKAADVFIHPTTTDVWGLVINEAMACGLPVITTDMCIAGLELIKNYENGFISKVNDFTSIPVYLNEIVENPELNFKMSNNNLNKIKWYTFETMAKVHIETLNKLRNIINE